MKTSMLVMALSLSLTGCSLMGFESPKNDKVTQAVTPVNNTVSRAPQQIAPAPQPQAAPMQDGLDGSTILQSCLKELNALQQVNHARYQIRSNDLNRIVAQAKQYMQVRGNLSNDVSVIMDAAYQYRIARNCNDIRTDLTRSLLERVGS